MVSATRDQEIYVIIAVDDFIPCNSSETVGFIQKLTGQLFFKKCLLVYMHIGCENLLLLLFHPASILYRVASLTLLMLPITTLIKGRQVTLSNSSLVLQ